MEKMLKRIMNGVTYFYKKLNAPIRKEIYSLNAKNTFIKAKADAVEIEKLIFSFVQFDEQTKKSLASCDIYMSFEDVYFLSDLVREGRLALLSKKEKAKGEKYPKPIYQSRLGGINSEKAKKRNLRTDGKAISRYFTIAPGSKYDYVITCEQRAGHDDEKGLIVPEGKPEVQIRVPCTSEELRKFVIMCEKHIDGYISSQYLFGYRRDENEGKKN